VTEEVAIRLHGDRARQHEREQQQGSDKYCARTRWAEESLMGAREEMHQISGTFQGKAAAGGSPPP